ncbi:MAG TPA: prepilin-type N-terminal cleavage/methylation domain-containing protein [Mesotoga infera]|nr:prepilin-type N-terminal cleavage/methylation domain-containing protein [Mesotoga sp.]HOI35055.1 prepilin-type N-terminal cleavage/methylation domain-containing protein [Mesotoga infera]HON28729.1 prepilin-type N-terminal cleavage/methylation domain-containing protein [Mesotoga infera]HPD38678.1 prepilin-type N-terminal cleavage/methylation domain-containing protein [Mesotoga infera]HRR44715.1 prepilin-type N-terminal cleavage/methylation domain-containing protein [Mesotoga sp.]
MIERKGKPGLTLMEVLIAMAIIVAVLIISFNIYNLWWKAYTMASNKAVIERGLTSAIEIIIKELRVAKSVALVGDFDSLPTPSSTNLFIGLDQNEKRVKIWSGNKNNISNLIDEDIDLLAFSVDSVDKDLLNIRIGNTEKSVELSSSVKMLNKNLKGDSSYTETSIVGFEKSVKLFE